MSHERITAIPFTVGYKSLSDLTRLELIDVAQKYNKLNRLNLTIATDSAKINDNYYPAILITPEGGAIDFVGTKDEVSKNIFDFIDKRSKVTWYRSEKTSDENNINEIDKQKFQEFLTFAQETHLLYDVSGNASMRSGDNIIVSPRKVDKSTTSANDACLVSVDHKNNIVYYQGNQKSSIDTGVNHSLYLEYPQINYLLHFHQPWGTADIKTSFPFPCGVKEEAQEIISKIADKNIQDGFCVELIHHGYLLGITENGLQTLKQEWQDSVSEFTKHLVDISQDDILKEGVLKPIFDQNHIIGVIRQHSQGATIFLREITRGKGLGKKIIDQLIERQIPIVTTDECGVLDYYKKFGFVEKSDAPSNLHILSPPRYNSL